MISTPFCQIFRWFFGKFKNIEKTFWNYPTFRAIQQEQDLDLIVRKIFHWLWGHPFMTSPGLLFLVFDSFTPPTETDVIGFLSGLKVSKNWNDFMKTSFLPKTNKNNCQDFVGFWEKQSYWHLPKIINNIRIFSHFSVLKISGIFSMTFLFKEYYDFLIHFFLEMRPFLSVL